jgi:hypothetical protein
MDKITVLLADDHLCVAAFAACSRTITIPASSAKRATATGALAPSLSPRVVVMDRVLHERARGDEAHPRDPADIAILMLSMHAEQTSRRRRSTRGARIS